MIFYKPINISVISKFKSKIKVNSGLIFVLLLFLAVFLRYFKLNVIPLGINIDEAGIIYDSLSLTANGVDRYGISWPVYFNNYGGGMSALYIYLNVLLSMGKITLFRTRFIIASFSIIMVIFTFLIIKMKYSTKYGLLGMFLVITLPYFVMSSRWALDCNLFLIISTISIYFFLLALNHRKKLLFFISGVLFGIVLYTYVLSYLVLPIFLAISIIYLFKTKKITVYETFILGLPIFIFAIPLFLFIAVNANLLPEMKLFNVFSITVLKQYRESELSLANIASNWNLFRIYLYGQGFDFNVAKNFGTIYIFSAPLILLGIFTTVKKFNKKLYDQDFIILFFLISCIFVTLLLFSPNISKSNQIYFSLVYFLVLGLKYLFEKSNISYILIVFYLVFGGLFVNYYFVENSDSVPTLSEEYLYNVIEYNESINYGKQNFIDAGYNISANIPILIQLNLPYTYWSDSNIANYDIILDENKSYDVYLIRSNNYIELESKLLQDGYLVSYNSGFTIYSKS